MEFIIFISILSICISVWFLMHANGNMKSILGPGHLYIINVLLYFVLGLGYLCFNLDTDEYINPLRIITFGLVAYSGGTFYISKLFNFQPTCEIKKYYEKPWNTISKQMYIKTFVIFVVGIFFSIGYFIKAGTIPILADNAEQARLNAFTGNLIFFQGIDFFLPLVSMICLVSFCISKEYKWRMLLTSSIILDVLFAIMTGHRGPLLTLVLKLVLVYQLIYPNSWNMKKLLVWLIPSFLIASFLSVMNVAHGEGSIYEGMGILVARLFLGSLTYVVFALNNFPANYPYFYGETWLWEMASLLPGQHVGLSGWLYQQVHPDALMASGANLSFLVEVFMNFGEIGAYLGLFILGMLTQFIFAKLIRTRRRDSCTIVILAGIMFGLSALSNGQISSVVYFYLIPYLACYLYFLNYRW